MSARNELPGIRAAGPDDATSIAAVFAAAWASITPMLQEADRDRFAEQDLVAMWRTIIDHPSRLVLLCEQDGVLGFIVTATNYDTPRPVHVRSLYVDPQHGRRGVGASLLSAAVGDRGAWLTVFETNTAARSFYVRNGWQEAGPATDNEGFATPLLRMERSA